MLRDFQDRHDGRDERESKRVSRPLGTDGKGYSHRNRF